MSSRSDIESRVRTMFWVVAGCVLCTIVTVLVSVAMWLGWL